MDEGDDEGQAVESGGILYPGVRFLKTGRTTGTTDEVVISTELIAWKGDLASRTREQKLLVVIGDNKSLVMVEDNTMLRAAGLLYV